MSKSNQKIAEQVLTTYTAKTDYINSCEVNGGEFHLAVATEEDAERLRIGIANSDLTEYGFTVERASKSEGDDEVVRVVPK